MNEHSIVPVPMPAAEGGAYEAVITAKDGPSLLRQLAEGRFPGRARYLVADASVAERHGRRYQEALDGAALVTVRPGEEGKTLAEVERVAGELLTAGVDRGSVLFALGGGALGDLAGFVAATLLRGLDYVHLPSTLLSMVDSSIGGKTAVNLSQGKNLLGAFHQPKLVLCDLQLLSSLDPRDRAAGLAEVLKHALLEGEAPLCAMEQGAQALASGPPESLREVVCGAIAYKAQIVAADPRERSASLGGGSARPTPIAGRVTLNLGHTIGHALESASHDTDDPLRHGEAVALGLVAEARIGAQLGLWPDGPRRLAALLPRLGLGMGLDETLARLSLPGVRASLALDKKRENGRLRFILLDRPGRAMAVTLDGARAVEMLLSQNVG